MSILGQLTTNQVVGTFNIFAKQNGVALVKKFKDRTTANRRLQDITRGKDRRVVVAALKQVGVAPEVIKLLPDTPQVVAEAVETAIAASPATIVSPAAKSTLKKLDAAKILAEEQKKESLRQDKVAKKEVKAIKQELKLSDSVLAVFAAIRTEAGPKDTEVSTTVLQTSLSTSWKAVSAAVETLKKHSLVKVEDDSADDDNPLWYVKLTQKGRDFVIGKVSAAAIVAGKPKKTLPAPQPGPRSSKNGKKIFKLVDGNPRREGTHGHKSFALIKDGMTYEQYMQAGGRNNDLGWDIDHKYVELR